MSVTATFTVEAPEPLTLTCPAPQTIPACQTQAAIQTAYDAWLNLVAGTATSGGCNVTITNDAPATAPITCAGGTVTVTFTATDRDADGVVCQTETCQAIFTVEAPELLTLTCPAPQTIPACQTQAAIQTAYDAWLNLVAGTATSGGCNVTITNDAPATAPITCAGGTVTVTFTATDRDADGVVCQTETCQAIFTVEAPELLTLTCPAPQTIPACQTQAAIQTAYDAWLNLVAGTATSGGCNVTITNDAPATAPITCAGGTVTVTFTATDRDADGVVCQTETCQAIFTVEAPELLTLTCPAPQTIPACQTQAAIQTAYDAWLNLVAGTATSGGCNVTITNDAPATAPITCAGGTVTVTFTATDRDADGVVCQTETCQAIFTVEAPELLTLTCPAPQTIPACQTQAAIQTAYDAWLNLVAGTATSGGCNVTITNDAPATAPITCAGGTVTVTFTATDRDADGVVCQTETCQAIFTVEAPELLTLTCPAPQTIPACQTQAAIQTAYDAWLNLVAGTATSGGCNVTITNDAPATAPITCAGGTVTVTFTATDRDADGVVCQTETCQAIFTVEAPELLTLTCPAPQTIPACQTQAAIQTAYDAWLNLVAGTATSGGCNVTITNDAPATAPITCAGGTVTVTFTATDRDADGVVCQTESVKLHLP